MIAQKLIEDVCNQNLILQTEIDRGDLLRHFHERDFYAQIYRDMAHEIATHIFKKIGPAIDKAMQEWASEANNE